MHVMAPAIQTIVVPTRMIVLLGLHNPPRSWTGTVGSFLTDFTIALVWIPCCAIGRSDGLSLSFKTVPKSKVCICISHIYILVVLLLPRLGEPLFYSLELWFLHVCVHYLLIT
jgi:hypothetical protein